MLRAHCFALPTFNAVAGFAFLFAQPVVVEACISFLRLSKLLERIHHREILRNGNVPGAALGAVVAGGAVDGNRLPDEAHRLRNHILFLLVKRGEVVHETGVVVELFHVAHAA